MRPLLLLAWLVLVAPQARALDGMSVELGTSDSSNASVDMARVGVQWNWPWRWALGDNWQIGGYWDLSLGYWDNDSRNRTTSSIVDVGFTPVFRLQQKTPGALAPYLEAAVGFHYLSKSSVADERRFGSRFQFGDHIGLGLRFGPRHAYDVGYRYQHLSNAGIKQPNQGINFHQLRLQYHF
ncbi:MAG: acyloxyacyl hydrolase [Burkholderiales bacterium]|nr:acyloxyacyl hydrolase [Burkholderiales bacterium]